MADTFWDKAREGFNSFWIADEPIEKKSFKADAPIGSNGVFDVNGYVFSPEDRTPLYNGERRFAIFDQMLRNTAIVAAGTRAIFTLLGKAEWTVNPPEAMKDSEQAKNYADIAYDSLFDMRTSWTHVVKKTASFALQGFSLQEITAKMRPDGVIGIDNIANRPQRTITRWNQDENGEITEVFQRIPNGKEVSIPRGKLIYAVDDTFTDAPTGLGLFRQLAPHADRLNAFLELQSVGFETDLRGIPIARAPLGELRDQVTAGTLTEEKRSAMLKPLMDFINKHIRNKRTGVMLPSDTFQGQNGDGANTPSAQPKWALELLQGQSTGLADMANAIKEVVNEMARILGVEHMLLGSDGAGSLALSKTKLDTFHAFISSVLQELVEVYQRDIIEFQATLNGWPDDMIPEIGVGDVTDDDIVEVTTALLNIATAGVPLLPNDPIIGELYDVMGYSRRPEDQMDAAMDRLIQQQTAPKVDPNATPGDPSGAMPKVQKRMKRILRAQKSKRRTRMAA